MSAAATAAPTKKAPAAPKPAEPRGEVVHVEHENIAGALAAFQAEVPKVEKGATAKVETKSGGSYSYQYADLAVVTEIAMPLLGRHGLAFTTRPTLIGDRFALHYALIHEKGEVIEGEYPLQDPTLMKPQEVGSAITYARRYTFCAVTGIAPGGDDDDANSVNDRPQASPRSKPQAAPPAPTEPPLEMRPPAKEWMALADAAKSRTELRPIYAEAADAGDLNVAVRNPARAEDPNAPEFIALGQWMWLRREALPDEAPAAEAPATESAEAPAGDAWTPADPENGTPTTEWPTVTIPTDGEAKDPS